MSKRAEKAALRAYPPMDKESHEIYLLRDGFINGYEQAEQDTIARACIWLRERLKEHDIIDESDVELFRKAMEDV